MKFHDISAGDLEHHVLDIIRCDAQENPGRLAVYLEGGHFDPRYPTTNFAEQSLHHALRIASQVPGENKKNVRLALGILVDDLGLQCGTQACHSPSLIPEAEQDGQLPAGLESILAQYPVVKRHRLIIQRERTCKNRGIQTLKTLMAHHRHTPFDELETETIGDGEKIYFRTGHAPRVLLAESRSKDIWTAKCPMIMAQHYRDVVRDVTKLHPRTDVIHIIDISEIDDYTRVIRGAEVATRLLLQPALVNQHVIITSLFLSPFGSDEFAAHSISNLMTVSEKE